MGGPTRAYPRVSHFPPRRLPLAAFASWTLLAFTLTGEDARASTFIRGDDPPQGSCSRVSADFSRWTPAAGPAARFIADAFTGKGSDLWIGLGYTDAGFWSAEAHAPNDACDACTMLDIVVTGFDGKRRALPVITSADRSRLEASSPEELKSFTLASLWRLAAKDWPVAKLQQDYQLRYAPNRDADGLSDPYPGWMVETSVSTKWQLRFALRVESHMMCWCMFGWRGWAPAAPRRP